LHFCNPLFIFKFSLTTSCFIWWSYLRSSSSYSRDNLHSQMGSNPFSSGFSRHQLFIPYSIVFYSIITPIHYGVAHLAASSGLQILFSLRRLQILITCHSHIQGSSPVILRMSVLGRLRRCPN
jgi:hypothetical protein